MVFLKKSTFLLCLCVLLCELSPIQFVYGSSLQKNSVNILLLSIDTLRSDHLACYGYKSIETPNIDLLAHNGILFTNAYSPVPLTLPSHVSIMTGHYPIRHGVHNNSGYILSDSAETLAEVLHQQGYATGAIVASYVLDSQWGLDQGFDYYDDLVHEITEKNHMNNEGFRKGEDITDLAKMWLDQNKKKPFFLWVHYFDPHAPYDPPAPFDKKYKKQPYDGEIAYMDHCVGHLLEEMKKLSLLENTLIILIGDHGEGLWEHQEQTHGLFIYNTTMHVPLILSYPEKYPKNKKVTSLIRSIDIMPTILEAVDIQSPTIDLQGRSLIPLITGKTKDLKLQLYAESRYPELNFKWAPLEGIVCEEWKYIHAPKPELYNLKLDPKEKKNLYSAHREKVNALQAQLCSLREKLSHSSNPDGDAQQIEISDEVREKLQSLGYICQGGQTENKQETYDPLLLPDPKDKVFLLAKIDEALQLDFEGQTDGAIEKYKEVVKLAPQNIAAHYLLGLAYRNAGELKGALKEMKKVSKLDFTYYDCQHVLGLLFDQLAKPDQAIQAFNKALKINPEQVYIHNNLGMVYAKMKALDLAKNEFKKVISFESDIDPLHISVAFNNLGGINLRQGNVEKAVEYFKKSLYSDSNNIGSHIGLANAYEYLGNIKQSIYEWEMVSKEQSDDHFAYFKLGQLSFFIGNVKEAIQYLKKSLQLKPDFFAAQILLQQIS
ncbi:MAG: sulfatase-like hydrolase/transferase [bacterium]